MAQALSDNSLQLLDKTRRDARKVRDASRSLARSLAQLEDELSQYGIGLKTTDPTQTAPQGDHRKEDQ